MSTPQQRILIVRLSHLGDVVHALPVFHALRAAHPDPETTEFGWVVQREFAPLLRGLPGLRRVFVFDRRGGIGAWRGLHRELAAWGPTWAVDAQGNLKSAFAARISGADRRSGLHRDDWREPLGAWLVPDRAPRASGTHAVERMRSLLLHVAPIEAGRSPPELSFDLGLTAEELARARTELAAVTRYAGRHDVVVHLATPGDVRSWSPRHFVELARALDTARGTTRRDPPRRALFLAGPAEEALARSIAPEFAHSSRVDLWIGQRGLRELAAVFTTLAKGGAAFIGCDSGPMHLAWAAGMRVVCLSGPQDARRTGPWPLHGRHVVVRARTEPDCAPCLARRCTHAEGPVCMDRIGVADVMEAVAPYCGG